MRRERFWKDGGFGLGLVSILVMRLMKREWWWFDSNDFGDVMFLVSEILYSFTSFSKISSSFSINCVKVSVFSNSAKLLIKILDFSNQLISSEIKE